jgi:hypothetical protein
MHRGANARACCNDRDDFVGDGSGETSRNFRQVLQNDSARETTQHDARHENGFVALVALMAQYRGVSRWVSQ